LAPPKIITTLIGTTLALLILAASQPARGERLPIKPYTTADGLPRDYISRIVQDSRGFLWFCTIEGLARFDGYQFKNYGTEQGLPSRYVNDFLETSDGIYWVATNAGLCRFNPAPTQSGSTNKDDTNRFIPCSDTAGAATVAVTLFEDHQGTVWVGGDDLYRLDMVDGRWSLSRTGIVLAGEGANKIVEDRQGSLWILSGYAVYRRRSDGMVERYSDAEGLPFKSHFHTILADRDGLIWLGTWDGLYRLVADPKPRQRAVARVYRTKDGLASDAVFALFQSQDGRLWAGVGGRLISPTGGLSEFLPDKNGGRFRSYAVANGLSDVDISTIAEDRDGNLWLGTETTGAMKLALSGLTSYDEADGFNRARVRAIFQDRDGRICAVGKPGVVYRLEEGKFSAIQINLPASQLYWGWGWNQIMLRDHLGEWWLAAAQGLVRYGKLRTLKELAHARPRAIYTKRNGLPSDEVFRIFEDSRGDIWIGTLGHPTSALTRWERATSTFHRYSLTDGVLEATPTAFCEDASGNLWLGFYLGGLLRYSSGRFTDFSDSYGLSGLVRAIYLDRAKRLWLATDEGGAIRIDNPTADRPSFIRYTTAQGLSSNQATCVTEDKWGRIYIGTGQGVNRLDVESGNITRYTTADGLTNSYTYVSLTEPEGSIWFGTFSGLSRLVPRVDPPIKPPTILITDVHLAGDSQPVSELGASELTLPELSASRNQIQIDFVGFGLGAGETLRYQYKFEGADWSAPTDQRSVNYPNLSPGSYRFLVRAISVSGLPSDSPAIVSFRILSPIWQRWWFLSLALVLIATIAFVIIRQRVSRRRERHRAEAELRQAREDRLRELEQVRRRIAADLHDDIGSNLTRISLISEVAQRKLFGANPTVTDQLSNIGKLSRELVDSMSEIVWAINPTKDHLSDLTGRMRHFASDVFTARQIEFRFVGPNTQQDIQVGANIRRELYLLFKEAVNNAVRHSGCSVASIEVQAEADWLVLKVTDNGRGFDVSGKSNGHGLTSMRERTEGLGGQVVVESSQGQGTSLTFTIPLNQSDDPQMKNRRNR
jgi:signal transduction histidine kinase/ligand-binding sensor domain-containing protein